MHANERTDTNTRFTRFLTMLEALGKSRRAPQPERHPSLFGFFSQQFFFAHLANSHRLAFVEAVHAIPAVTVATTGAALELFKRETPQVFLGNLTKNDFSFSRHGTTSLLPN